MVVVVVFFFFLNFLQVLQEAHQWVKAALCMLFPDE